MPDIIYIIVIIECSSGLFLFFGTMALLYPQHEKLRSIGERTFPDRYQRVLYVWRGSWCTPLAFAITFFRWFGAKPSIAINQLAKEELNLPSYWLLVTNAVAMVLFLSGILFLFITTHLFGIVPPWEQVVHSV